jgi:hypothetical protein
MRRLFHSRFVAIGLLGMGSALACISAGCGSSEQPEAYPGAPINPPSKQDDLLDMMTGTGAQVASVETAAPTATAVATATAGATAAPTAAPTAKPKATAKPTATPTATPTAKPTAPEMAPKKK